MGLERIACYWDTLGPVYCKSFIASCAFVPPKPPAPHLETSSIFGAFMQLESCKHNEGQRWGRCNTAWGHLQRTMQLPGVCWKGLSYLPEWHRGFQ